MPVLLGLLALIGGAFFWYSRMRTASAAASELADMAETVLGAARRFGFRRRANVHPVDSIDDPRLAIAGLCVAFAELGRLPTAEERRALGLALQSKLETSAKDAEEMIVLGHWFVTVCGGPDPAVTRIARKLERLAGVGGLTKALAIADDVARTAGGLSEVQREALADLARTFRLR